MAPLLTNESDGNARASEGGSSNYRYTYSKDPASFDVLLLRSNTSWIDHFYFGLGYRNIAPGFPRHGCEKWVQSAQRSNGMAMVANRIPEPIESSF
jgi:hypothetical protein